MQSKPNVGTSFFEVRGVNLSKLIEKAGEVSILKIDIEGYEVELLPTILSSGCLKFVKNVFVETHDKKWPDLHEKTSLMKSLCSQANHTNFFWNWP